jgi:hypothetical protein
VFGASPQTWCNDHLAELVGRSHGLNAAQRSLESDSSVVFVVNLSESPWIECIGKPFEPS